MGVAFSAHRAKRTARICILDAQSYRHRSKEEEKKKKNKKMAPLWMQEWHIKGNIVADKLADQAAAYHGIPIDKAKQILDVFINLKLIQNRILHI